MCCCIAMFRRIIVLELRPSIFSSSEAHGDSNRPLAMIDGVAASGLAKVLLFVKAAPVVPKVQNLMFG